MRPEPFDVDALVRSSRDAVLVLRPDLTIAGASDAYLRATMTWPEDIVGRRMFDAFPDSPYAPAAASTRNLGASFERVLHEGAADAMPLQRYDVRDHVAGGAWVEKHWLPFNSPVFGAGSREVVALLHRVKDVTRTVYVQRALEEELVANREQQDTLRAMYETLVLDEQRLRGAREEARRAIAEGRVPTVALRRDLDEERARERGEYLGPGDVARVLGTYDVFHPAWCRWRAHDTATLAPGEGVPVCPLCGEAVRYRLREPPKVYARP